MRINIFNFEEVNGRALKEIEIVEYPSTSRFMDFKSSRVSDKILNVTRTGVYKFRFLNSAVAGRICKVKVQRIPGDESTKDFNCSVYWQTVADTTWIIKTRQIVEKVDTIYDEIASIENQIWLNSRGHSSCLTNSSGCTKHKFKLSYHDDTEEIYVYIVADQSTAEAYSNLAKKIASIGASAGLAMASGGTTLLVDMFANKATEAAVESLPAANSSNKIDIYFAEKTNADFWYSDNSNRIQPYGGLKFKGYVTLKQRLIKVQFPQNEMYLCLKNNNSMVGIPVFVNIVAMRLVKEIREEQYQQPEVSTVNVPYLKN